MLIISHPHLVHITLQYHQEIEMTSDRPDQWKTWSATVEDLIIGWSSFACSHGPMVLLW